MSCRAPAKAMPVLTVNECSPLSRTSRAVTALARRSATSVAPRVPSTSGQITMNSSPLSRATVSVERTAAVSRRRENSSTSSPAAWPDASLIDLEAVDIEHEDRHVDALASTAAHRVGEPVERERPVRKVCERVVQRGVARRLLVAMTFDGNGDERRDRAEERHVVL